MKKKIRSIFSTWLVGNCYYASYAKPAIYAIMPIRLSIAFIVMLIGIILGKNSDIGKILIPICWFIAYVWLIITNGYNITKPNFFSKYPPRTWIWLLRFVIGFILPLALLFQITFHKDIIPLIFDYNFLGIALGLSLLFSDVLASVSEFDNIEHLGLNIYCKNCGWRKKYSLRYSGSSYNYFGGGRATSTAQYNDEWSCPRCS